MFETGTLRLIPNVVADGLQQPVTCYPAGGNDYLRWPMQSVPGLLRLSIRSRLGQDMEVTLQLEGHPAETVKLAARGVHVFRIRALNILSAALRWKYHTTSDQLTEEFVLLEWDPA